MVLPVTEIFSTMSGGIVSYRNSESRLTVLVRLAPDNEGRLDITECYLPPGRGYLTGDDLRSIRLGRIQSFANSTVNKERILDQLGAEISIEEAARLVQQADDRSAERVKDRDSRRSAKVPIPKRRGRYPDSFYVRIAEVYNDRAVRTGKPAADLAAANNVPLSTAHRWVREARNRGLLAPGRTGKVG